MLDPHQKTSGWVTWVLSHPKPIFAATIAFIALSTWIIIDRLQIDTSVEAFAAAKDVAHERLDRYHQDFGRDEVFLVLAEGDVFSPAFIARLKSLHTALEALDLPLSSAQETPRAVAQPVDPELASFGADDGFGADEPSGGRADQAIESVLSLVNLRGFKHQEGSLVVLPYLPEGPLNQATLDALKPALLSIPELRGQVLGPDGRHAVLVVKPRFTDQRDTLRLDQALHALLLAHQAEGFHLELSGMASVRAGFNELILTDMKRLMGLAALVMVAVLAFVFRHPLGVLIPLLVVLLATVVTFAFMALVGYPVTLLSNVLPAFLVCVGLGDAIHILSVYRDLRAGGMSHADAVRSSASSTGRPVIFTSLTTMVGLASFKFSTLDAIQAMGLAGAVGVGAALVFSLTLVPLLLQCFPPKRLGAPHTGPNDRMARLLKACLATSAIGHDPGYGAEPAVGRRRRRQVLAISFGIGILSLLGAAKLRVFHDPLSLVPDDEPLKVAFVALDRSVGGAAEVQLVAEGDDVATDPALLAGMLKLVEHIEAYRDPKVGALVTNHTGLPQTLIALKQGLTGKEAALPTTREEAAQLLLVLETAAPEVARHLVTADHRRLRVTVRIRWLESTAYQGLTSHIEQGIATLLPPGARVEPTGSVYTLVGTISSLIANLISSFGSAFAVISLLMVVVFRHLGMGLLAMLPNLLPIAMVLGLMGFTGIPIDMNNLLMGSIALGIAVDDTIHLGHHFITQRRIHGNGEEALRFAFAHSGRAVIGTSVILTLGFMVYSGARMYALARFGVLVGAAVVFALIADLILTPALLRTFFRRPATRALTELDL